MPTAAAPGRLAAQAVDLAVRAHSSPRSRRLVPAALAMKVADPYARRARAARGPYWERLRAFHEELLAHTPLAGQEEEIAQRACAEMVRHLELYWRPWLMRKGQVRGMHHHEAARSQGRGVVAVFPHHGISYAKYPIMARAGIDAWGISGANHFTDLGNGYIGRFSKQGRAYVEELGPGRAFVAGRPGGAFAPALAALRRGATVSTAFDLPGSSPTQFLGRRLNLASGASKLPVAADAPVVPLIVRREGLVPVLTFGSAIDPREHADAASVQSAIAAVMERWTLDVPEVVWPLVHAGTPLINGPALAAEPQPA